MSFSMSFSIPTVMEFGSVDTEMNPAFRRLRWSVFEDVSRVRVVEDLDSMQPKLFPFLDHHIVGQLATDIPLDQIHIDIDAMMEWEASDCDEPESLTVGRADGGAVTVGDVVKQLSSYVIVHKKDILEATAPFLSMWPQKNVSNVPALGHYEISDDTRAFFKGFTSGIAVDDVSINVKLWVEGQFRETFDDFLKKGLSEEDLKIGR